MAKKLKKARQPRNWQAVNAQMRNSAGSMKDKSEKRLSNEKHSWLADWESDDESLDQD